MIGLERPHRIRTKPTDMLISVSIYPRRKAASATVLLIASLLIGCHKEEQAVTKVASSAATAEQRAQAASAQRDKQRAELAKIALPTKSRYIDVHEPGNWSNPFLSFDTNMINVRITVADANPSTFGQGGILRPSTARRRELQIRQQDLIDALIALPDNTWPYGRVVAIEESPLADRKARPAIRRQIEAAIQQLNDLGVVVDEWPTR
jgi:hypothetical protein